MGQAQVNMDASGEFSLGGLSLCVIPTQTLQAIRREAIAACGVPLTDASIGPAVPAAGFHTAVIAACEQHLRLRAKRGLLQIKTGFPAQAS